MSISAGIPFRASENACTDAPRLSVRTVRLSSWPASGRFWKESEIPDKLWFRASVPVFRLFTLSADAETLVFTEKAEPENLSRLSAVSEMVSDKGVNTSAEMPPNF